MSYDDDDDMKYAYTLYQKGVDESGKLRQKYLQQALNVLNNVPDEWPEKSDLVSRITHML